MSQHKSNERNQFAWGLIGWLNFIALALCGLIVAHALGYSISVSWWWIAGGAVLTIGVFALLIWGMMKTS